jgi:hypothetical protein
MVFRVLEVYFFKIVSVIAFLICLLSQLTATIFFDE